MTESEAIELRQAAWRINRLCAVIGSWSLDENTQDLLRLSRDSAARLREMAGPLPLCRGNGG